uniref:Uncharacterized protein n=1 Tax=Compsopogon caeruleus TaxID=31354 RepID=A0A7S1TD82_9RHOD
MRQAFARLWRLDRCEINVHRESRRDTQRREEERVVSCWDPLQNPACQDRNLSRELPLLRVRHQTTPPNQRHCLSKSRLFAQSEQPDISSREGRLCPSEERG